MSAILVLVLISVAVAVLFLFLFIKAVRAGQYEDDYSPSVRILFDPEDNRPESKQNNHNE